MAEFDRKKKFAVRVLTPEGPVLTMEATSAIFPASDGLVGILPHHSPLMAALGRGAMFVRSVDDHNYTLDVTGGFAEFRANVLTVLADSSGQPVDQGHGGPFGQGRGARSA